MPRLARSASHGGESSFPLHGEPSFAPGQTEESGLWREPEGYDDWRDAPFAASERPSVSGSGLALEPSMQRVYDPSRAYSRLTLYDDKVVRPSTATRHILNGLAGVNRQVEVTLGIGQEALQRSTLIHWLMSKEEDWLHIADMLRLLEGQQLPERFDKLVRWKLWDLQQEYEAEETLPGLAAYEAMAAAGRGAHPAQAFIDALQSLLHAAGRSGAGGDGDGDGKEGAHAGGVRQRFAQAWQKSVDRMRRKRLEEERKAREAEEKEARRRSNAGGRRRTGGGGDAATRASGDGDDSRGKPARQLPVGKKAAAAGNAQPRARVSAPGGLSVIADGGDDEGSADQQEGEVAEGIVAQAPSVLGVLHYIVSSSAARATQMKNAPVAQMLATLAAASSPNTPRPPAVKEEAEGEGEGGAAASCGSAAAPRNNEAQEVSVATSLMARLLAKNVLDKAQPQPPAPAGDGGDGSPKAAAATAHPFAEDLSSEELAEVLRSQARRLDALCERVKRLQQQGNWAGRGSVTAASLIAAAVADSRPSTAADSASSAAPLPSAASQQQPAPRPHQVAAERLPRTSEEAAAGVTDAFLDLLMSLYGQTTSTTGPGELPPSALQHMLGARGLCGFGMRHSDFGAHPGKSREGSGVSFAAPRSSTSGVLPWRLALQEQQQRRSSGGLAGEAGAAPGAASPRPSLRRRLSSMAGGAEAAASPRARKGSQHSRRASTSGTAASGDGPGPCSSGRDVQQPQLSPGRSPRRAAPLPGIPASDAGEKGLLPHAPSSPRGGAANGGMTDRAGNARKGLQQQQLAAVSSGPAGAGRSPRQGSQAPDIVKAVTVANRRAASTSGGVNGCLGQQQRQDSRACGATGPCVVEVSLPACAAGAAGPVLRRRVSSGGDGAAVSLPALHAQRSHGGGGYAGASAPTSPVARHSTSRGPGGDRQHHNGSSSPRGGGAGSSHVGGAWFGLGSGPVATGGVGPMLDLGAGLTYTSVPSRLGANSRRTIVLQALEDV